MILIVTFIFKSLWVFFRGNADIIVDEMTQSLVFASKAEAIHLEMKQDWHGLGIVDCVIVTWGLV